MSWNTTDLITKLPIKYGMDVVCIPIKRTNKEINGKAFSYPVYYFKPIPVILYGKYNDYGCMYDIKGDTELFSQIILKEAGKTIEEMKFVLGMSDDDSKTNIEIYLDYIERGHCSNIGLTYIDKALFDELKNTNPYDEIFEDIKQEKIEGHYKRLISAYMTKKMIKENNYNEDTCLDYVPEPGYSSDISYYKLTPKEVNKKTIEYLVVINQVLENTRNFWFPQCGAGDNSEITKSHDIILNYYKKYLKRNY